MRLNLRAAGRQRGFYKRIRAEVGAPSDWNACSTGGRDLEVDQADRYGLDVDAEDMQIGARDGCRVDAFAFTVDVAIEASVWTFPMRRSTR